MIVTRASENVSRAILSSTIVADYSAVTERFLCRVIILRNRLQKYFLPDGRKSVSDVCAKRRPDVIKRSNVWNRTKLNIAACSC